MIVTNVGSNGTTIKGIKFEPGSYVEVSDELGEYLLNRYTEKYAITIVKAPDALQHEALLAAGEESNIKLKEKLAQNKDLPKDEKRALNELDDKLEDNVGGIVPEGIAIGLPVTIGFEAAESKEVIIPKEEIVVVKKVKKTKKINKGKKGNK